MLSSIHSKILIEHLVNTQHCSRQAGSTLNKMGKTPGLLELTSYMRKETGNKFIYIMSGEK